MKPVDFAALLTQKLEKVIKDRNDPYPPDHLVNLFHFMIYCGPVHLFFFFWVEHSLFDQSWSYVIFFFKFVSETVLYILCNIIFTLFVIVGTFLKQSLVWHFCFKFLLYSKSWFLPFNSILLFLVALFTWWLNGYVIDETQLTCSLLSPATCSRPSTRRVRLRPSKRVWCSIVGWDVWSTISRRTIIA